MSGATPDQVRALSVMMEDIHRAVELAWNEQGLDVEGELRITAQDQTNDNRTHRMGTVSVWCSEERTEVVIELDVDR